MKHLRVARCFMKNNPQRSSSKDASLAGLEWTTPPISMTAHTGASSRWSMHRCVCHLVGGRYERWTSLPQAAWRAAWVAPCRTRDARGRAHLASLRSSDGEAQAPHLKGASQGGPRPPCSFNRLRRRSSVTAGKDGGVPNPAACGAALDAVSWPPPSAAARLPASREAASAGSSPKRSHRRCRIFPGQSLTSRAARASPDYG